jgi:PAS domain S-box-containing protein
MDGYFKYLNPAWEKTLGYTQQELLARPFLDFIHPDDHAENENEVESLAAGHPTIDFENRYIHKNGSVRNISWMATPLVEEETMYCIGRDITQRKQAEQAIQRYQQRLKALSSQLTIAEERERRRIAADLHDNVGQSLALARMQLAVARKSTQNPVLTDKLDDVSQTLLEILQDTRHLIFELSSPAMNEIGLGAAISEWLDAWTAKQADLEAEYIEELDDRSRKILDDSARAILFRNVRELVTNVAKHARTSRVQIILRGAEGRLQVTVEDNGIGFDPDVVQSKEENGGFGLFSIRERMTDLGGSLEIMSGPGLGCRAVLTLPVVP